MGKRGKSQKKYGGGNPSKRKLGDKPRGAVEDDMDDEIDAFHKQREIVSLDIDEGAGDSDQDSEQPVFDVENITEEDDEDEDNDAPRDTGLAAKIVRQQKFIKAKFGGVEDEMHNDDDGEEEQKTILGRGKYQYYDADNHDFELQSSDDESAKEEEAEVLRLQRERAVSKTREDYGLEVVCEDESDKELTFEEISVDGKNTKSPLGIDVADDMGTSYVEVKKDLNALSKEEKMNFLYNSAAELSGLLPDLNDALEELESRVNPLLTKVKKGEVTLEGGMHYLEVKQLLLLAYCQAITFYLLLKSEGQPVRDHPVVAHLTEIKSLLNKMKELDENLPSGFEDILNKYNGGDELMHSGKENATEASDPFGKGNRSPVLVEAEEEAVSHGIAELKKVDSLIIEKKGGKRKYQNDEVGVQSMKMLKVRAELEEKLKQKGVISSITPKADKPQKHLKPLNGKLESYDDFGDDTVNVKGANQGSTNGRANKLAQLVAANQNKSKVVSGDDDLPQRDDIGERRRKHELRVLAGAGIKSEDDAGDGNGIISDDGDVEMEDNETGDSEDELYEQVKKERLAKLAAKARMYSGPSNVPTLVETETIDGKRHITYQMEKNRGLTRPRKKEIKNPRKKYKLKHQKAVERRKGQVREVKKPIGRYGGEVSGINAGISRSTRFKN